MREVPGHHPRAHPAMRHHDTSVYIDNPSLNRAAAQGLFQPMAVGWRRAFPSGLRNAAATYQHFVQQAVGAQEAQRQAVLTEQDQDPRDR